MISVTQPGRRLSEHHRQSHSVRCRPPVAAMVGRSNNGHDGFNHGELSFVPAEAQVAAQHFPAVEIANGNQLSQQALALGARSYCKKRSKHTFHPLAMVGASGVGDQAERRYTLLLRKQPQNAIAMLLIGVNESLDCAGNISNRYLIALAPDRLPGRIGSGCDEIVLAAEAPKDRLHGNPRTFRYVLQRHLVEEPLTIAVQRCTQDSATRLCRRLRSTAHAIATLDRQTHPLPR